MLPNQIRKVAYFAVETEGVRFPPIELGNNRYIIKAGTVLPVIFHSNGSVRVATFDAEWDAPEDNVVIHRLGENFMANENAFEVLIAFAKEHLTKMNQDELWKLETVGLAIDTVEDFAVNNVME